MTFEQQEKITDMKYKLWEEMKPHVLSLLKNHCNPEIKRLMELLNEDADFVANYITFNICYAVYQDVDLFNQFKKEPEMFVIRGAQDMLKLNS